MKKTNWSIITVLVFILGTVSTSVEADSLRDAERLLRVTNTSRHFESLARGQIRAILRTYSSIVATSTKLELPLGIQNRIAQCYTEVYAWDNFESGFAQILAENLDTEELRLLIDFYRDLGIPPAAIGTFKAAIAKAKHIEQQSLDFMLANSQPCVEQDSRLIMNYVATASTSAP